MCWRGRSRIVTASTTPPPSSALPPTQPTSFVSGRYEVRRFLGEGGKKKVYLAHDSLLDRDVAFALIKIEGLDDAALTAAAEHTTVFSKITPALGLSPTSFAIWSCALANCEARAKGVKVKRRPPLVRCTQAL